MSGTTDEGQKALAAALGRITSGIYILTARHGKLETGMLASWIQQCSFDPPQITAAFGKDRWILDWLIDGAAFGINVLAEGQKALTAHFGKGFAPEEKAFEGLEVQRSAEAAPILLSAHAHLDCRVVARQAVGDHLLVVGRVLGGGVSNDARPAHHVRKNGMHY